MDAVGIALVVSSCLVCSGVLLAGGVVLLMWQDRWARRGPPALEAQRGAPVQVVAR